MATLPEGGSPGLMSGRPASKTWRADPATGRLSGFTDGLEAMGQAVEIALSVRRFRWPIYGSNVGHQISAAGEDSGAARVALQAQVRDALSGDERITGVEDFTFAQSGDTLTAAFTVHTLFGPLGAEVRA